MNEDPVRRGLPPLSVRTLMVGLILATLLPLLAFSAFLAIRTAQHEQALLAATVQDRTRTAARDIEQELSALRAKLFAVAAVGEEPPGDFSQLYARAQKVLGPHHLSMTLSTTDGHLLFDTRLPLGTPLGESSDVAAVRQVAASGSPYISSDSVIRAGEPPVVMIDVPVMQDGRVVYVAGADVAQLLQRRLMQQQLPAGWIATISDRRGYTLARSLDPQHFVGQVGRADFLRRVRGADEGWFPYPSREGIPLYIAYSRVQPMDWTMVVGIPLDVLYAPVRHSSYVLLLVGAGMLMLALALAMLIGHRISGPIRSLVGYAAAVGQGEPVPPRLTGLRETDAVAVSLRRASDSLHQTMAEREQAAAALHASEERKQVLHQAVLAQENERKRIARELHDSLGQYLTALQLGLNALGRPGSGGAQAEELGKLRGLTSQIGCEVNRIAWELRPTALDDLGLKTAIAQYLEEWGERSQLQFDLQVNLGNRRLPQTIETTVYRALQEAVTNIVRHAEADHVAVILEVAGRKLQLIVEDDGKGFPIDDDSGGGGQGTLHLGLLGIRERLALVDGTLEIESSPGGGTSLFVRVPV